MGRKRVRNTDGSRADSRLPEDIPARLWDLATQVRGIAHLISSTNVDMPWNADEASGVGRLLIQIGEEISDLANTLEERS